MKRAALFAAIATMSGCTPSLSEHPEPEEILSAMDRPWIGEGGVLELISTDGALEEHVLVGICSASPAWLKVAHRIYPSNYAHLGEEMSSALAVALTKKPEAVLGKFDYMCHEPEELPEACDVPTWRAAAVEALRKVDEPSLEAATRECIASLGPAPKPYGNGECMRLVPRDPNRKPDVDGPGTGGPLQSTLTLGCLSYVAFDLRDGKPQGTVLDESGRSYTIFPGSWIGENGGRVIQIDARRIMIEQIVADENGDPYQQNHYMFRAKENR